MKRQKNRINKRRLEILGVAKKIVPYDGWNENIIQSISNESNISVVEIHSLFPNNYKDLLKFYLRDTDIKMIEKVKKINLDKLRTHEKIYQIIMIRIKNNINDKELIRKTLYALSMPFNSSIALSSLYKTVDNIWYLSNDKSYDFNYYTKRAILAFIYSSVLFFWINDNSKDIKNTEEFLRNQIKKTTLIKDVKKLFFKIPNILNFRSIFKKAS